MLNIVSNSLRVKLESKEKKEASGELKNLSGRVAKVAEISFKRTV